MTGVCCAQLTQCGIELCAQFCLMRPIVRSWAVLSLCLVRPPAQRMHPHSCRLHLEGGRAQRQRAHSHERLKLLLMQFWRIQPLTRQARSLPDTHFAIALFRLLPFELLSPASLSRALSKRGSRGETVLAVILPWAGTRACVCQRCLPAVCRGAHRDCYQSRARLHFSEHAWAARHCKSLNALSCASHSPDLVEILCWRRTLLLSSRCLRDPLH